jgi:hypothetical protein
LKFEELVRVAQKTEVESGMGEWGKRCGVAGFCGLCVFCGISVVV